MLNAYSTDIPPIKLKSLTPGLLLKSITFCCLHHSYMHIMMKFFIRVYAVSRSSTKFKR